LKGFRGKRKKVSGDIQTEPPLTEQPVVQAFCILNGNINSTSWHENPLDLKKDLLGMRKMLQYKTHPNDMEEMIRIVRLKEISRENRKLL
jgi:hypothetical protein